MTVSIQVLPLGSDNYAYLLADASGHAAVIDPAQAGPVAAELERQHLTLSSILLTHHHSDHIGGSLQLKDATGAAILAPADSRIRGIDERLHEGAQRTLLDSPLSVLSVPGHTRSHLVYYFTQLRALFTGDTLFCAGCGRLFEGSPAEMLQSLTKCAELPDATLIYCGHEYTEENLRFALSVDPNNAAVHQRLDQVRELRRRGQPTVPSTVAIEKATNPFLRVGDVAIRRNLDMSFATDVEVFAELRSRKDRF